MKAKKNRHSENRHIERKTIYILALFLLFIFVLSGCNFAGYSVNTVEITDMLGRTVFIPEEPQRIAILDPFAGYAVIMLGYGDKMVATTGGIKRDVLIQSMLPSLVNTVVVKEEGAINGEALLKLKPDLIIIKGEIYNNTDERNKLDRLRIPYLVIEYRSMEEQCEAMRLIDKAFGNKEKAEAYIDYYHETIRQVTEIVKNISDEKRPTLYHSINTAITTDAVDSIGAEWIAVTGVKNVSMNAELLFGEKQYNTTLEEIYIWDPDVIICNESGINEYILMSSQWQGLRAVREKRVYQMPIGVSRMGHFNSIEVPLAIWWLSALIYPEYFTDFDFREELKTFYSRFFDYELDQEAIDSILAGHGMRPSGAGN